MTESSVATLAGFSTVALGPNEPVVPMPIAGVSRHAQIVEYDVLIRFTQARLAVVFDKLDHETISRLLMDTDFRLESLRSRQTELQAMASLLHRAIENKRDVRPLPLPVDDIFDALDEQVLVDQYPKFPGHLEANAAWEAARSRVPNRKIFYQERFGVVNAIETYRKIAALMRTFDRIPTMLRDLGANLERMAAEESYGVLADPDGNDCMLHWRRRRAMAFFADPDGNDCMLHSRYAHRT